MQEDKLLEQEEIREENDKENNKRKYTFFFIIFVLLFFFSVFGLTYSIYKGDDNGQEIITGEIIFSYTEVDKVGNGIDIKDALPMPDEVGKKLLGKNQYFDFNVTATSKDVDIAYKLLVKKSDLSTLTNDQLRIYLVSLSGSFETELVLTDFSNLKQERVNDTDYYVLYQKKLDKGVNNHTDYYRLRMWVKEDAKDCLEKTFSLKVAAHAVQSDD